MSSKILSFLLLWKYFFLYRFAVFILVLSPHLFLSLRLLFSFSLLSVHFYSSFFFLFLSFPFLFLFSSISSTFSDLLAAVWDKISCLSTSADVGIPQRINSLFRSDTFNWFIFIFYFSFSKISTFQFIFRYHYFSLPFFVVFHCKCFFRPSLQNKKLGKIAHGFSHGCENYWFAYTQM